LLALVRLFAKRNPDEIWDFVLGNYRKISGYEAVALFMSQQKRRKFVTVMFDTKSLDDMQSFIVDQTVKCPEISDTRTIPLMQPVFLPIPKERPHDIERYSVTVKVHPSGYRHVYEAIIGDTHDPDLFAWYVAYALGEYDVVCSVFAKGKKEIDRFSRTLRKLRGVSNVTAWPLKRTKIITTEDEWNRLRVRLLYRPGWLTQELEEKMLVDYDLSVAQYSSMG
jgi:hypothetical protein